MLQAGKALRDIYAWYPQMQLKNADIASEEGLIVSPLNQNKSRLFILKSLNFSL
jgi:hypothetical protein